MEGFDNTNHVNDSGLFLLYSGKADKIFYFSNDSSLIFRPIKSSKCQKAI